MQRAPSALISTDLEAKYGRLSDDSLGLSAVMLRRQGSRTDRESVY